MPCRASLIELSRCRVVWTWAPLRIHALNRALWLYVAGSICLRAVFSDWGWPNYAPTRTDRALYA